MSVVQFRPWPPILRSVAGHQAYAERNALQIFDLLVARVEAKAPLPPSQCIANVGTISQSPSEPGNRRLHWIAPLLSDQPCVRLMGVVEKLILYADIVLLVWWAILSTYRVIKGIHDE